MTKEELKEYNRKYRLANKERIAAQKKAYNEDNKQKIAAQKKVAWESLKDGFYTVYYLPEEHYIGMTVSLHNRLIAHKNKHNRHVQDVEVVGKYKTKKEALAVEAKLHSMGYLGRNNGMFKLKNK